MNETPSPLPWIEYQPTRLTLTDGTPGGPILVQRADPGRRPYLHPLRAADGVSLLTEDAPSHHPWQHGVSIGLNDPDGVGYWTEGLLASRAATDGRISAAPLDPPCFRDGAIFWVAEAEYRRPDGRLHFRERQAWTWCPLPGRGWCLDMDWTLATAAGRVAFPAYEYGGLFIRMPWHEGDAVEVLADDGAVRREDIDTRPARWVAMALAGDTGAWNTLAVIDHPANPCHPQPWRFDSGHGFGPGRCIAGPWDLEPGLPCRQRYRLLALPGKPDATAINPLSESFA
jgi:hypothetical protein